MATLAGYDVLYMGTRTLDAAQASLEAAGALG